MTSSYLSKDLVTFYKEYFKDVLSFELFILYRFCYIRNQDIFYISKSLFFSCLNLRPLFNIAEHLWWKAYRFYSFFISKSRFIRIHFSLFFIFVIIFLRLFQIAIDKIVCTLLMKNKLFYETSIFHNKTDL